jgi:sugar phosphate isomerase/epimerase
LSAIFSQYLIDVAWHARALQQFAFARERGFGVEIEDFRDPAVLDDRAEVARLVAWCREQLPQVPGLISLHGPFDGVRPGAADPALRAAARARTAVGLEVAEAIGASRVVFHIGIGPVGAGSLAPAERAGWLERLAATWREVLADRALEVVLENVWETSPEALRDAVDAIALPNLGACLDAGHANLYGQVSHAHWVEVLGARIRHLHLHDNARRTAEDDEHLLPGYGTIRWLDFARVMRAQGLCVPAVIEVGPVPAEQVDTQYLDRLNAGD